MARLAATRPLPRRRRRRLLPALRRRAKAGTGRPRAAGQGGVRGLPGARRVPRAGGGVRRALRRVGWPDVRRARDVPPHRVAMLGGLSVSVVTVSRDGRRSTRWTSDGWTDDAPGAARASAELVIAGPQYRRHGTIRLVSCPAASPGRCCRSRCAGTSLGLAERGHRAIDGRTCRELAEAAGVDVGPPRRPVPRRLAASDADERLAVDEAGGGAARRLVRRRRRRAAVDRTRPARRCCGPSTSTSASRSTTGAAGKRELRRLAWRRRRTPRARTPTSGPWQARTGEFWNAPFGAPRATAARRLSARRRRDRGRSPVAARAADRPVRGRASVAADALR